MKKLLIGIIGVAAMLGGALAAESIATTSVLVNGATTNTASINVRGLVEYVKITAPTGATGSVTLVTADGITLYSNASVAGTVNAPVRVQITNTGGAGQTNSVGGAQLDQIGIADTVTATVIQAIATTNTYGVKVVFRN